MFHMWQARSRSSELPQLKFRSSTRADVKAFESGSARTVAVFCVTKKEVDPDGFTTVAKGPKPQQPHLGDFIRSSAGRSTSQGSTKRFRPLSLSDWQDIAADVRGKSHKGQAVEAVPPAPPAPSSFLYFPNVHICVVI